MLIEKCAYLVRPWIYNSFKGCAKGLEVYKKIWKFIESSILMCVKCALGNFKGKTENYYGKAQYTITARD